MLFLAVGKIKLSCSSGYCLKADGAEGDIESRQIASVEKLKHKGKGQFSSTDAILLVDYQTNGGEETGFSWTCQQPQIEHYLGLSEAIRTPKTRSTVRYSTAYVNDCRRH